MYVMYVGGRAKQGVLGVSDKVRCGCPRETGQRGAQNPGHRRRALALAHVRAPQRSGRIHAVPAGHKVRVTPPDAPNARF